MGVTFTGGLKFGSLFIVSVLTIFYGINHICNVRDEKLPPIYKTFTLDKSFSDALDALDCDFNELNFSRRHIPVIKKAESIGYKHLLDFCGGAYVDFYESEKMLARMSELSGHDLVLTPIDDNHRLSFYRYNEVNDFCNWHYDKCLYEGHRFTVIIMIIEPSKESQSMLQYYGKDKSIHNWAPDKYGGIIFNGDTVYHSVHKMETESVRMVLNLEYLTTANIGALNKIFNDLKDWIVYNF